MKRSLYTIVSFALFTISCGKQSHIKAFIYERKEAGNQKVMIKYQYLVLGKMRADSAIVSSSMIIKNDSLGLSIDPANSERYIPDLKN